MKKICVYFMGICVLTFLMSCTTTKKVTYTVVAVANIDPFPVGKVPVGINQFLASDITVNDVFLSYDPRKDDINLEFNHQMVKYLWQIPKDSRASLIADIQRYQTDFEARTLVTKGKQTAYGVEPLFIKWGLMTKNAQAHAKIKVGYKFVDSAPYFTLILPVTDNELFEKMNGAVPRSSSYIACHFTRAQATEFARLLSEEYLAEKLAEKNVLDKDLPLGQQSLNAPDVY